ncbi:MAG: 4-hydroxy-tetrahydrodipicolinate reductase [Verrucomicrobiota bacterium JB022]|nr:4-hydroxy-tetrahydrodipicolinate reductase [Verrucomicrobiota bacterium JB022]
MSKLPVLIYGSRGRMGRVLTDVASACQVEVVATIDQDEGDLTEGLSKAAVAIDFSFHAATVRLLEAAVKLGKGVVIGTTGHTPEEQALIRQAAEKIPVVWAGNYSIGVNLLFYLTRKAAAILGDDYQPEILELHHRHKKDAPSGTAANLVDLVREARDLPESAVINGREGITGERPNDQIGVHAVRGGQIIGEHTVFFIGEQDRIELTHRAQDRGIFARGAHRAARWVNEQPAGLYDMRDVLGLKD